jgi:hypothetical protein
MPYTFTTHNVGEFITAADINALSNAVKYDTTRIANVLEYGAVEGGGTDCTTAFQNALNAVGGTNGAPGTATGGGIVLVPAGIWRVGQLSIPHRTRLLGSGWGTVLRAQSGQTVPMIVNASYNDAGTTRYVHYCTVENLRLDGSDMSSAATGAHGIYFQNPTASWSSTTDEEIDGFHRIYRVEIRNVWGDGILLVGRGASDLAHNSVQYAQGNGINIDTDNTITACDCGRNRRNGFKFTGGNIRASNLISWGNGQTNAGVSAQTEVITDLDGNGFRWQGSYRGGTYTGLIAQDNRRAGFLFANTPMQMTCYGLVADSNNAFNQTIAATNYAGFEIFGGYSNVLEGKAHDRNGLGSWHQSGLSDPYAAYLWR